MTNDKAATVEPVEGTVLPANIKDGPAGSSSGSTELDKFLYGHAAEVAEKDDDAYSKIVQQVMDAETPDAVLTPVEALQARDLVGIPLVLGDFELNKSEFDVGSPFYASMACVRMDSGESVIINCGHKKVLAQLVKLKGFDDFPYKVMFRTRGVSKIGGTPMLELTKWPEEVEAQYADLPF